MAKAGSIDIFLNANIGGFVKGMKLAARELSSFDRLAIKFAGISGAINTVQQSFNLLSGAIATVSVEIGKLDELADTAQRLSITTDSFQKLRRAVELSGGEIDGFEKSLSTLQRTLGDASLGQGKSALATLDRLELNATALADMNLADAFKLIVERISEIPIATERASLAADLFGKSSANLGGLLKDGSSAFAQAGADIDAFGVKLDDLRSKQLDATQKSIERLSMAWDGLKSEIAITSSGPLEQELVGLTIMTSWMRKMWEQPNTPIMQLFQESMDDMTEVMHPGTKAFKSAVAQYESTGYWPSETRSRYGNVDWSAMERGLNVLDAVNAGKPMMDPLQDDWVDAYSAAASLRQLPSTVNGGAAGLGLNYKDMLGAIKLDSPELGFGATGGAGALEFGSAAAFSAIQQSRREDEALRLQKQQLEEAKKQTKAVEDLLLEGIVLGALELQG